MRDFKLFASVIASGFELREPLINSESYRCAVKMRQIEALIAANSQSIRKICNDELSGPTSRHFNQQLLIHELIRGSLSSKPLAMTLANSLKSRIDQPHLSTKTILNC